MADLFIPTHLLIIFVGFPLFIVPFWRIFKKAGFPPALSLLVYFPLIGLIVLYYVAFVERQPRKPKEPERPKIDVEEVREHIDAVHHSIIEHLNGEIAILKKYLKSKGVLLSAAGSLDEFRETTEAEWKNAVEVIDKALEEQ